MGPVGEARGLDPSSTAGAPHLSTPDSCRFRLMQQIGARWTHGFANWGPGAILVRPTRPAYHSLIVPLRMAMWLYRPCKLLCGLVQHPVFFGQIEMPRCGGTNKSVFIPN